MSCEMGVTPCSEVVAFVSTRPRSVKKPCPPFLIVLTRVLSETSDLDKEASPFKQICSSPSLYFMVRVASTGSANLLKREEDMKLYVGGTIFLITSETFTLGSLPLDFLLGHLPELSLACARRTRHRLLNMGLGRCPFGTLEHLKGLTRFVLVLFQPYKDFVSLLHLWRRQQLEPLLVLGHRVFLPQSHEHLVTIALLGLMESSHQLPFKIRPQVYDHPRLEPLQPV
ncbi:uncharacterized protein G2W53_018269 [Senna tora]|uniref:Uncharacterized protein n=1 Tax=Senna tora TaxID=362788 RepID=A0A834WKX5_9FABA|nr:uncharacterized protein G2W53_018269 [Senna tora]